MGLQDRLNYLPNQLSGGQQWVSIGPALITRSTILLADEPIGNLDSTNSAEIMELFTQFHREEDQTLVLITHASFIVAQAQRILQIRDGTMTALQKREFAILKSLGMIEKILMQSTVYSLEAAFLFTVPWWTIVAAILGSFFLALLSAWSHLKDLKKLSIIQAIKMHL